MGGLPYGRSNGLESKYSVQSCGTCGPSYEKEVKGALPCGAILTAKLTSTNSGIAKIHVAAGHDFCVGASDRITLTFRKDGVQPLIDFLRKIEREL